MPSSPNDPRKSVFVISPIGAAGTDNHTRFKMSLKYIIKKALPVEQWQVVRADEESAPDSITGQVIGRIRESDIIVADLSDHNPNVFYELAVAHGYKRPVIHLMEDGQKVPFDVGDQRVIFYDLTNPESVDEAVKSLRRAVAEIPANGEYVGRNPLTQYEQFATIRGGEASEDAGPAVADALSVLTREVSRLARRMDRLDINFHRSNSRSTRAHSEWDLEIEGLNSMLARVADDDSDPEAQELRLRLEHALHQKAKAAHFGDR